VPTWETVCVAQCQQMRVLCGTVPTGETQLVYGTVLTCEFVCGTVPTGETQFVCGTVPTGETQFVYGPVLTGEV
jgi:hypothetical protein